MPRDFKFVHLRMHSDCSMVNGLNDIRKIMKRAGGKGLSTSMTRARTGCSASAPTP